MYQDSKCCARFCGPLCVKEMLLPYVQHVGYVRYSIMNSHVGLGKNQILIFGLFCSEKSENQRKIRIKIN